jgi:[protein-PII] uridylyltransferase
VDAFYVVGPEGKITDARRRNAVRNALVAALAEPEAEAANGRRANLQRARASVAR